MPPRRQNPTPRCEGLTQKGVRCIKNANPELPKPTRCRTHQTGPSYDAPPESSTPEFTAEEMNDEEFKAKIRTLVRTINKEDDDALIKNINDFKAQVGEHARQLGMRLGAVEARMDALETGASERESRIRTLEAEASENASQIKVLRANVAALKAHLGIP